MGRTLLGFLFGLALVAYGADVPRVAQSPSPAAHLESQIVKEFRFSGNRIFSARELGNLTQPYLNRPVTFLDLEEARVALTTCYVNHGYVNSGAVIDDPQAEDGVFTFRIVEGRLADIQIDGDRWFREEFYKQRLLANGGDPLNVNDVRNTLQIWRDAYPVEQVNADIQPGAAPGDAIMRLKVKEKFPYHLGLQYANNRPPGTGSEQVDALFRTSSLTGFGDQLALNYGIVRGQDALNRRDWLGTDDMSASYSVPVTPWDTTLGAQYSRSSAAVVAEPFAQLGIESQMDSYGLTLSQPFYRTPTREFSMTLSGERKASQTYLLGFPYSFSPGAEDGRSAVSVLRLSSQFTDRGIAHSFAARASLNVGVDTLGATCGTPGRDGRFVSLVGQTQYLQRLWETQNELLVRLAGQYTNDPVLPLEQFPLGGASTVRGYRENTMVRDRGFYGTVELHVPIWKGKSGIPILQLAPFADYGAGWNNDKLPLPFKDIASVGVGLLFSPHKNVSMSVYWGSALRHFEQNTHSLQDDGIHFRAIVWAF